MNELLSSRIFGDADELSEQIASVVGTVGMNVYDRQGNLLTKLELWDEGDGAKKLVIE
jgi:hypothetical protein